jgi:putative membrane protein
MREMSGVHAGVDSSMAVVVPLAISGTWYLAGFARLWARAANREYLRNAACFVAGWVTLALALLSPLDHLAETSFAAHMAEHELLMLVAAPLLVLSRPVGIALWALPRPWRLRVGGIGQHGAWRATWRGLSDPVVATILQVLALAIWHAPALFGRALASPGWHVAQHTSFLVTALLFWTAMFDPALRARPALPVGCLFLTSLFGGTLGAFMALSSSPWYAAYATLGVTGSGLSPVEDQQLAGLLMWVPGGLVHAVAGLALLGRVLRERGWADAH